MIMNCLNAMVCLQLLLEKKNKEVGKLIEETEKNINDLAENINQAKVCSSLNQKWMFSHYLTSPVQMAIGEMWGNKIFL